MIKPKPLNPPRSSKLPKPPLEKDIQKAILDYLRHRNIFCWRQNQGGIPAASGGFRRFVGMPGLPDICGILESSISCGPDGLKINHADRGRALFIEVKRPGGKASPQQLEFMQRAEALGALAFVASSVKDIQERGL